MTRQAAVDIEVEQLDEAAVQERRERFGFEHDESVRNGGS